MGGGGRRRLATGDRRPATGGGGAARPAAERRRRGGHPWLGGARWPGGAAPRQGGGGARPCCGGAPVRGRGRGECVRAAARARAWPARVRPCGGAGAGVGRRWPCAGVARWRRQPGGSERQWRRGHGCSLPFFFSFFFLPLPSFSSTVDSFMEITACAARKHGRRVSVVVDDGVVRQRGLAAAARLGRTSWRAAAVERRGVRWRVQRAAARSAAGGVACGRAGDRHCVAARRRRDGGGRRCHLFFLFCYFIPQPTRRSDPAWSWQGRRSVTASMAQPAMLLSFCCFFFLFFSPIPSPSLCNRPMRRSRRHQCKRGPARAKPQRSAGPRPGRRGRRPT